MGFDVWMRHFKQGGLFVIVGLAQLTVDTGVFISITALGVPVAPANIVGRISGASLGFWLNGRYTFADQGQPRVSPRHLRRFAIAWTLLTCVSTLIMNALSAHFDLHKVWSLKPVVELVIAAIGFVVWRQWVYR